MISYIPLSCIIFKCGKNSILFGVSCIKLHMTTFCNYVLFCVSRYIFSVLGMKLFFTKFKQIFGQALHLQLGMKSLLINLYICVLLLQEYICVCHNICKLGHTYLIFRFTVYFLEQKSGRQEGK